MLLVKSWLKMIFYTEIQKNKKLLIKAVQEWDESGCGWMHECEISDTYSDGRTPDSIAMCYHHIDLMKFYYLLPSVSLTFPNTMYKLDGIFLCIPSCWWCFTMVFMVFQHRLSVLCWIFAHIAFIDLVRSTNWGQKVFFSFSRTKSARCLD